jgi:hypothetical protein
MSLTIGDAAPAQPLRGTTAKAVALGTIAAVVAAALILRAPSRDVPRTSVSARLIPITILALPRAASRAPMIDSVKPDAPRVRATVARVAAGAIAPEEAPAQMPDSSAPNDEPSEPSPLDSRSMTFVAEPRLVEGAQIVSIDAARRGAITRALGTTAGAFRTAGSSVAGAFRKVF